MQVVKQMKNNYKLPILTGYKRKKKLNVILGNLAKTANTATVEGVTNPQLQQQAKKNCFVGFTDLKLWASSGIQQNNLLVFLCVSI